MARKRMISPEFFSSAQVNRLPVTAMVTFAGLWCYLDDYGRGEDDAALVKAAVWPRRRSMSEARVAADLDVIVAEGLICRYEAGKELANPQAEGGNGTVTLPSRDHLIRVIHSPTWTAHQKISHPTASKFPPCPLHETQAHVVYLQEHPRFPESLANGSRAAPETRRRRS